MSVSSHSIKLPSELFAVAESSRFEGVTDLPLLEVGPDDYRFDGPVSWEVDVTNTGSAFLVAGVVRGSAHVACSRCLDDVSYAFDGSIEGFFLIDAQDDAGVDDDGEIGEDEFDVLPSDHVIDLLPLLKAALIVDAPNVPLCRDDCAGLCPRCGANLNESRCACGPDFEAAAFEKAANPFSVLEGFAFDDDSSDA